MSLAAGTKLGSYQILAPIGAGELFYVAADQKLMAVPVKLSATVEAGMPQPLFPVFPVGGPFFYYAPMRDGQRFLVNVPAGGEAAAAPRITVVTNWQRSLSPQSR